MGSLIRKSLVGACITTLIACIFLVVGMKGMSTRQQDTDEGREIARLMKIIRNERLRTEDPDKVAQAIATLGELRATVAVEDLIKLITFRRTFPQERGNPDGVINEIHVITRDGRYPAVGSLFAIGKPALPSLIKLISSYDSKSLESENALTAVMAIFRDEPQTGVQYLKDAGERSSSSLKRQRLLIAADRAKGPPL